jgi:hypothetical protein
MLQYGKMGIAVRNDAQAGTLLGKYNCPLELKIHCQLL